MDDEFKEQLIPPPPVKTLDKEIIPSQGTEEPVIPELTPEKKDPSESISTTIDVIEPAPILTPAEAPDNLSEIYSISQQTLNEHQLDEFAAIELIPDKTMRIILTGDLLFTLGQAELSAQAKESLKKITAVIKDTPYMINVVGHTDNIPCVRVNLHRTGNSP